MMKRSGGRIWGSMMRAKVRATTAVAAAILTALMFGAAGQSGAVDWNWMKGAAKPKPLKRHQKITSVAAVRGAVESPSDVDPDARDPEGLAWMEARPYSAEKSIPFIIDGKLKIRDASAAAKDDKKQELMKLASDLGKLAGQPKLAGAIRQLTPEEEAVIGRDVAANVIAQFGLLKNEALTDYVTMVGRCVAMSSPRKEVVWRFAILDTPIVNAFAAPGGYIFITKGLLMSLKNEAELACVLGHEIGHVTNRHVVKEIQRSKMLQSVIPEHVHASAKKAEWMNQVSQFAVQLMWKGLSREDEYQSDADGAASAYNTGYDPKVFVDVLNTLKAKAQAPSSSNELKFLLSTHPKPEDRLKALEAKAAAMPSGGEKVEPRFKQNTLTLN